MKKLLSSVLVVLLVLSMVSCTSGGGTSPSQPSAAPASQAPQSQPAADSSTPEPAKELTWRALYENAAEKKYLSGKKFSFIVAAPDDMYATYQQVFKYFAEKAGAQVTFSVSDMSEQKELDSIQDAIASGVDAICLITVAAGTGGRSCKMANDAGIPIFMAGAIPDVESNNAFYNAFAKLDQTTLGRQVGTYMAEWCIKNGRSDAKFVTVDGPLAQAVAHLYRDGFSDMLVANGMAPAESVGEGSWTREGGLKVVQDLIASGREFDGIYFGNEEMLAGGMQALEEAGIPVGINVPDGKLLGSTNGKAFTIDWIREGKVVCVSACPPTLLGDILYQEVLRQFNGFPVQELIEMAGVDVLALEPNTLDRAISWNLEEYQEQVESGKVINDYEVIRDNYNATKAG